MSTFYVTFGQRYRHEPHPCSALHDLTCQWNGGTLLLDGWVEVEAGSHQDAQRLVGAAIGSWSSIYSETPSPRFYPEGCLARITADGEVVRP